MDSFGWSTFHIKNSPKYNQLFFIIIHNWMADYEKAVCRVTAFLRPNAQIASWGTAEHSSASRDTKCGWIICSSVNNQVTPHCGEKKYMHCMCFYLILERNCFGKLYVLRIYNCTYLVIPVNWSAVPRTSSDFQR